MIAAGRSVAKIGDKTFSPRPGVAKGQLTRILVASGWSDEFALKALISWTPLLRLPSECWPLPTRRAWEKIALGGSLGSRAASGLSSGSGLVRVCVWEDFTPESLGLHVPQLFCPVCRPRPAITRVVRAGQSLFPNWTARWVLEEPRSLARSKEWRNGERMGTHSL